MIINVGEIRRNTEIIDKKSDIHYEYIIKLKHRKSWMLLISLNKFNQNMGYQKMMLGCTNNWAAPSPPHTHTNKFGCTTDVKEILGYTCTYGNK